MSRVGDVGHLFEDQLLDLGPGQLLEQQARAGVHQHRVARPQCRPDEPLGQLGHPLLVGPADDDGPAPVLEDLLERDDLAGGLGRAGQHDVERLVEHDLAAPHELVGVELGVDRDAHLAAARVDVDRAVVVAGQQRAVGRRRLGELVDLFAQGGDVLARLAQGVGELLVLGHRLGELALGLEQPLLERAHPLGGVLEAPAQGQHLFLEGTHLLDVGRPVRVGRDLGTIRHRARSRRPPPRSARRTLHRWTRRRRLRTINAGVSPGIAAFIRPVASLGPRRRVRPRVACRAQPGPRPTAIRARSESRYEGLDRPGSLHGRRPVRRDRP